MDNFYLISSTVFFLVGFVLAVVALRSGGKQAGGLNIGIAVAGLVFQSLFLYERGELHGRCPITNGAEVLVFISWSIVIMYLVLGRAFRLSLLGVFSMPIVFLFQSIAIVYLLAADPGAQRPDKLDPWLEMHAAMSLLAYGAYGLAFVAGIMYLVQDCQIKSHQPGRLFRSLPPIRFLSDALFRLLVIGTLLLTVGIVSAFFMEKLPDALHLIVSWAVWIVYAGILAVHLLKRLAPRILSLSAIAAFIFALATLTAL